MPDGVVLDDILGTVRRHKRLLVLPAHTTHCLLYSSDTVTLAFIQHSLSYTHGRNDRRAEILVLTPLYLYDNDCSYCSTNYAVLCVCMQGYRSGYAFVESVQEARKRRAASDMAISTSAAADADNRYYSLTFQLVFETCRYVRSTLG